MTALTPEAFLALPPDPEEDAEPAEAPAPTPSAVVGQTAPRDSLALIADGVQRLVTLVEGRAADEEAEQAQLEAFDDLDAKHARLYELVEEIEGIVKGSTSKVSLSVKAAIDRWRSPALPSELAEPPAHDADVEQWREHARSLGVLPDEPDELDSMNRAQIRTLLGISQIKGGEE